MARRCWAGLLKFGTAFLSTSLLPAGTRHLRAYYLGDSSNSAATSNVIAQTVNAQPIQPSQVFAACDDLVGRAPWPAADPLVGLLGLGVRFILVAALLLGWGSHSLNVPSY